MEKASGFLNGWLTFLGGLLMIGVGAYQTYNGDGTHGMETIAAGGAVIGGGRKLQKLTEATQENTAVTSVVAEAAQSTAASANITAAAIAGGATVAPPE